jgi:hypothetical protein
LRSQAVSLLEPQALRRRLAETGSSSSVGIALVKRAHPDFDPTAFQRSLRAFFVDSRKFLWGSDGRHSLYDLAADPLETRDLLPAEAALGARLEAELDSDWRSLGRCDVASLPLPPGGLSPPQRKRLEALGYLEQQVDVPVER